MRKQENKHKDFKKMTTSPGKGPGPSVKKNRKDPVGKEKLKTGQTVTITLLVLIILILGFLVFLFFQPRKIQLWQQTIQSKIPVEENLPDVQRLIPEKEPEPEISEALIAPEREKITEAPEETQLAPIENSTREARLFYVKVNTEGQITLKGVSRDVTRNGSPLTETINSLLKGPSSAEINKGSLTLVPDGTRLLSARVEGNTAFLNFNEAFRFNSLGREGYIAQLKQVVYTATEFPNINQVQILIEGTQKEYLGGEGMYVGEPLSRESFQTLP